MCLCCSDQALSEARATLEQIKEEMEAWQTQHNALHKKLKTEKAANSTLKAKQINCVHNCRYMYMYMCNSSMFQQKQMEVLQYECELVKELKKEAAKLREKLSTMEGYAYTE